MVEQDFVVVLEGKSITAMGEARYWEIHVKATSKEEAIAKAMSATSNYTVFDTHYSVIDNPTCPVGSFARLEVDDSSDVPKIKAS